MAEKLAIRETVDNWVVWRDAGDWERFISEDLVAYIDGHYRTLAKRISRGLAGHSMGGYGALRIAFGNPELFGSVSAHSAALMRQPPKTVAAVYQRIEQSLATPMRQVAALERAAARTQTAAVAPAPTPPRQPPARLPARHEIVH